MLYFIVNPLSRSGKGHEIWDKIHELLEKENIDYEFQLTKYHGHAIEIAHNISSLACDTNRLTIIVLGGDGTLNEVLNGLSSKAHHTLPHITLGYIPTGSGNDFSRSMKIPKDIKKALEIILHPKEYTYIDYGIIKSDAFTRNFMVSAGIGFDASISHETLRSNLKKILNNIKLGKLTYLLIGIKQLFLSKNAPAKLTIDSNIHLDMKRMLFTSIHVQKYEGGGFPFAPSADPTDGKLEVCVFYDSSKIKYAFLLISSIFGKHTNFKGVNIYSCKSVTLSSETNHIVHTDGEDFGFLKTISACSSNDKIRFISG